MSSKQTIKAWLPNPNNGAAWGGDRNWEYTVEIALDSEYGAPKGTFIVGHDYSVEVDGRQSMLKAVLLSDDGKKEIPYFGEYPDLSNVPKEKIVWLR